MQLCFEYVVVGLGNHFISPDENLEVVQCFVDFVEYVLKNKSPFLLTKEKLSIACADLNYFRQSIYEVLLQPVLSWELVVIPLCFFAQIIQVLSHTNQDGYGHLLVMYQVIREFDLNDWVKKQKGDWQSFLDKLSQIVK